MADIIEVIRADRAHIARCQDQFCELGNRAADPGCRQAQAVTWATLASLIELHLDAEAEICGPAIYQVGPHGPALARSMLDEHEDIRELIREARLQSADSRLWWQLATATLTAWTGHLDGEEHGIPAGLRCAGPALRQRLGRQWQAFIAAQIRDQGPQAPPPVPSSRLLRVASRGPAGPDGARPQPHFPRMPAQHSDAGLGSPRVAT